MSNDASSFEEDFSSPDLYDGLKKAIDALPCFQSELNQIFADAHTILIENKDLQEFGLKKAATELAETIFEELGVPQDYVHTEEFGSSAVQLDPRKIFELHQKNIAIKWDGLNQPLKNTESMAIGCLYSISQYIGDYSNGTWREHQVKLAHKVLIFGEWLYFTKNYRQEVRVTVKQKIKKKHSENALKGKARIYAIHEIIEQFYDQHKNNFKSTQKVAEHADKSNIAKLSGEENKYKLKLEAVVKHMRKYKKSLTNNSK